jgi:hypothetical protein
MKAIDIPIARVRAVLWYEPWSGRFYWREKIADKVVVGREAGNDTGRRDVRISIDGVLYQGHRLAFAWMTGEQPPQNLDHRDLNTRNNAWENIRPATHSTNGANRPVQVNNLSTGVKGVYHYPDRKKPWLARLQCRGALRLNRFFATQDEAVAAYRAAALEWFGEFART